MANKLKNLHLTSVDLVRAGANQEADICLYKSAEPQEGAEQPTERERNIFKQFLHWLRKNPTEGNPEPSDTIEKDYTTFDTINNNRDKEEKLWKYSSSLTDSIRSIMSDETLDSTQKHELMKKSLGQFDKAMETLIVELCEFKVKEDVVKGDNYDTIVEVVKKKDIDHVVEVQKFNPYHGKDGRFTSGSGGGAVAGFGGASAKEFADAVAVARDSCPEDSRWRVTAHTQQELEEDFAGAKMHVTKGGSTVAVATNGDIVSVCKNQNDTETRGKDLMKMAVENGGTKLDSFSGNHTFYTKCGFEPVSWTPFNETYAPPGWRKGVDKPEPVVFYKYTGKQSNVSLKDFLSSTKPFEGDDGYDNAMKFRDQSMEE